MKLIAAAVLIATVLALDNGLALTPPMGWMHWEQFRCQVNCKDYPDDCISEKLFTDMADRLAEDGWLEYGYGMVNIDDCWMGRGRDERGRLYANTTRFPHGIKWLADYVHSKGVKFGIYNDYGTKTCGGYTGSEGYLERDAETFAEWGVDYLKMDGCYSAHLDQGDAYPAMRYFLNATRRPIVYSCSWPAYDMAMDYTPLPRHCNLWRNWDDIESNWASIRLIMDKFGNETRWVQYAGPGHWNDADMLVGGLKGPRGQMTEVETQTQFAIWAILASPLFLSVDLRALPVWAERVYKNKEIIAVNQDAMGKQGYRMTPYGDDRTIWRRELGNGDLAIALMNRSDEVLSIRVMFDQIGSAETYAVRDLYLHEDLGEFTYAFTGKNIPPHGVRMLRLTPVPRAAPRFRTN